MTNLDRQSVAKLLGDIANRLLAAPVKTLEAAKHDQATHGHHSPHPYQAGALEIVCRQEAHALLMVCEHYLTPKAPASGRRRGRR